MRFEYIDKIKQILKDVEELESKNIIKSCEILVDAILNKKSIFIFGASHAGILAEEVYYRAGGLVLFNPIFAKGLSLDTSPISLTSQMERLEGYGTLLAEKTPIKSGDVVFIHSVSGRNPVSIELAIESKRKGAKIIAITNLTYSKSVLSRHKSNKNLYEVTDLVIDNHGDIGDAAIEIKGHRQKVGATSTVIGATILNTIVTEVTKILIDMGIDVPPVFYSANLDGGDEKNKKIIDEYKDVIHYEL